MCHNKINGKTRRSIQNTKFKKEPLVEDENHNNYNDNNALKLIWK